MYSLAGSETGRLGRIEPLVEALAEEFDSCQRYSYSSVAIILGQVIGEQNSVIAP